MHITAFSWHRCLTGAVAASYPFKALSSSILT
jgi:hypothetical protein